MKPSTYYDRVVDVMEELFKFTLLTRDVSGYLVDRYSERKESAVALASRVDQRSILRRMAPLDSERQSGFDPAALASARQDQY